MKLKDIQVGGRYIAKVSGKLVTVQVLTEKSVWIRDRELHHFTVMNLATRRLITVRSPQRFRRPAEVAQ